MNALGMARTPPGPSPREALRCMTHPLPGACRRSHRAVLRERQWPGSYAIQACSGVGLVPSEPNAVTSSFLEVLTPQK